MWNILAVDRWTKYIGLSYRNERSESITPIGSMMNDESLFFNMGDILWRYHITKVAIWFPKQHEELQKKIDTFIEQLLFIERELDVTKVNEEYTSVEAWATTGDFKKWVEEDTVASMKILERYLSWNIE